MDAWALYHYVNRSYVLFSRSPKSKGKRFYGQSYPCGVMWDEPDPSRASHLWITNPAADDNAGEKGNRPNGIHTHGVTLFEQELQHKDALLWVFQIDHKFRNPYVLGYVPGGYRAMVNDANSTGRIFLHYGSVLVAIASSQPFSWKPNSGIRAPAANPCPGDSEFRIMATKVAAALETALPDEFPGRSPQEQLTGFRQTILARSKIALVERGTLTAHYTDRAGNRLACSFDGEDRVNDQIVDYANWPVVDNPWMQQHQGGNLTVRARKCDRVYDFYDWDGKGNHTT